MSNWPIVDIVSDYKRCEAEKIETRAWSYGSNSGKVLHHDCIPCHPKKTEGHPKKNEDHSKKKTRA